MQMPKQMGDAVHNGSRYQRNLWFESWTLEPMTLYSWHCIKYSSNSSWERKREMHMSQTFQSQVLEPLPFFSIPGRSPNGAAELVIWEWQDQFY